MLTADEGAAMLREAALAYAEQGQPVFPAYAAGPYVKRPLVKWRTAATTDPDRIARWWSHDPHAIGLPTGVLWDVLDIDAKPGRPNGYVALRLLDGLGVVAGAERWARTPSGGAHAYFPASRDMPNATYARHGIDLRGDGGYVLAPPSFIDTEAYAGSYVHVEAKEGLSPAPLDWRRLDHLLVGDRRPVSVGQAVAPGWLSAALAREMREAVVGERNSTLFRKACRALEFGLETGPIERAALEVGLTQDEIARTVRSATETIERKRT